jgi:hypothetical protein
MTLFAFRPRHLAAMGFATVALTALPGPSDEVAIRAAEHQWLDAEYHADTVALKQLLLPEYRTVSWKGVHTRDDLIAAVVKRGGKTPEPAYPTPTIEIRGATALAMFSVPGTSYSVDVFVYENGSWHAIYSQDTRVKPEA